MTEQERILELLKKHKWTKYKLAKEAGLHPTTVYGWFKEPQKNPDKNSIECVCAVLNISQAEFYSGIDESELEPEQLVFLELLAKVPQNKHKIIFDLMRSLAENQ